MSGIAQGDRSKIDRAMVERLVRESLLKGWNPATGAKSSAPSHAPIASIASSAPKLVVNVSARHAHVTQEDLERLFGKGHQLKPFKMLYQDGFFAAEETLTIVGPRQRIISGLRILGPCRDHSQVELAFTDAIQLGIDPPVRKSGDHRDSPGAYLIGPKGMIHLTKGVIRHERHVHMSAAEAAHFGVRDGDRMHLRIKSDCPTVLEGLLVRISQGAKLEAHIDTDEGNACNLARATHMELYR